MKAKPLLFALGLLLTAITGGLAQPAITTQPQDQTNVVGTTATFSVVATGAPSPSYQWTVGSPPVELNGETNAMLILSNVQVTSQAPYQVVVANTQGSITSSVAHLYVVSAPTVQFSISSYTVAESAGDVVLSVTRTGSLGTTLTIDYATADGSATNGLKYTAVSGTLAFEPSETNKTIVVPILNEGFSEGTRTFRAVLSNPTGGAVLSAPSTATVSITDNDVGLQLQFFAYFVAEDGGVALIGVVRGDDGTLPVSVDFATSDITAAAGVDYLGTTNSLMFAPQERLKWVLIPILNNTVKQPNRAFRVSLANPVGATLGTQHASTVTILDSDRGFQFQSATNTVAEDAGAALIAVLRGTDDTNSSASVDYATSDGTATSGLDYLGATNTLSFAPGDTVKLIRLPILNDGVKEADKSFRVTLSNPTGGSALGSPTLTIVTISDNDPGLGFEFANYTNAWGSADGISVTVLRGNDWAMGPVTVDFATSDLTARAGQDYQGVSGTLVFNQNETVKEVTIPILRGRMVGIAKFFRVNLSNQTGGATLGRTFTTVRLVGSFFTLAPPFETVLSMQSVGGLNTLTWTGGGLLQRADQPTGPWQTLASARSPTTIQSPVPTTFYRVARPRPVNLYVPSSYDGQTPTPLVINLHGYHEVGTDQESYLQLLPLAEARGFLYCYPDGLPDAFGNHPWNATDACCDFGNARVDDAAYFRALLEEFESRFAVDRKRVFLIGFSNGGFMAFRMACQSADLIAGIVSLSGATFLDQNACSPSQPVNILNIHGTADNIVGYWGGAIEAPDYPSNMPAFPGALQTVELWAGYNGCTGLVTDSGPSLDLTLDVAGLDTVVTRYSNFPPGGAVELWTIIGGSHGPTLSTQFSTSVINWLLAHPKP